ncbi:hypothetical protein ACO1NJ_14820, partial [Staphylococcus aureus]
SPESRAGYTGRPNQSAITIELPKFLLSKSEILDSNFHSDSFANKLRREIKLVGTGMMGFKLAAAESVSDWHHGFITAGN